MTLLAETIAAVEPLDEIARAAADERQQTLTKPAGSLGRLEDIASHLAAITGEATPTVPEPSALAVFAADHGVHAQGVSPWPQAVTAQMVLNMLAGGAMTSVLARQCGTEVTVVDVGVAAELPGQPGLVARKVGFGTADLSRTAAMTAQECQQAVEVGIEVARDLVAQGNRLLLTGDLGIANTTASAALVSVFTGAAPALTTGRGTGIDDVTLAHKIAVVDQALETHDVDPADPLRALAAVGGFEHAALVGYLIGAAALRTPVIIDGVIGASAGLVAAALCPLARDYWFAGHVSAEPASELALRQLGLAPILDLDLRLGEGSGAVLAVPIVQAAARVLAEGATFESAEVAGRDE